MTIPPLTAMMPGSMRRDFDENEFELMDLPNPDPQDLEDDLTNLGIINRYFGGTRAVLSLIERLSGGLESFTAIDLATGFGDHPRNMMKWARSRGKKLKVIAVDNQFETLKMAKEASRGEPSLIFVQADARALPFKQNSADLAFCSLALHHFSETDAVKILRECHRTSKRGMACMDLTRSRFAYVCVWLLTQFILRARMTKHDARMSIRRAFTGQELKILAHQAGWSNFWHSLLPWFRQEVVCVKNS